MQQYSHREKRKKHTRRQSQQQETHKTNTMHQKDGLPKPDFFQVEGILDDARCGNTYSKNVLLRWEIIWSGNSVDLREITRKILRQQLIKKKIRFRIFRTRVLNLAKKKITMFYFLNFFRHVNFCSPNFHFLGIF